MELLAYATIANCFFRFNFQISKKTGTNNITLAHDLKFYYYSRTFIFYELMAI